MRMSRRMGLLGTKMIPSEVVVDSGGAINYWASASDMPDKWHRGKPYTNDTAYFGRNQNKVEHIAAVCFTTCNFVGKSKNFKIDIHTTAKWAWQNAMVCSWQLSRHKWETAEEWAAGSKECYSKNLVGITPNDPNAVSSGTFKIENRSNDWFSISGDAELTGNTQYVLYIWRYGSASDGMLVGISQPQNFEPIITITG